MPETPQFRLSYSEPTSAPEGWLHQKELAEDVERALADLDRRQTSTTGASAGSGWGSLAFEAHSRGGIATVRIQVTRTGANIETGSGSNVGDTTLATIPPAWRPPYTVPAIARDRVGFGQADFGVDGLVVLRAWSAFSVIDGSREISTCATYVLP